MIVMEYILIVVPQIGDDNRCIELVINSWAEYEEPRIKNHYKNVIYANK